MDQLREQKTILAARQLQAEKNVRLHWNNLKEELRPANMAAGALDTITHGAPAEKTDQNSVLKSIFTYGLSLLANKLAAVADEKIKKVFRK